MWYRYIVVFVLGVVSGLLSLQFYQFYYPKAQGKLQTAAPDSERLLLRVHDRDKFERISEVGEDQGRIILSSDKTLYSGILYSEDGQISVHGTYQQFIDGLADGWKINLNEAGKIGEITFWRSGLQVSPEMHFSSNGCVDSIAFDELMYKIPNEAEIIYQAGEAKSFRLTNGNGKLQERPILRGSIFVPMSRSNSDKP